MTKLLLGNLPHDCSEHEVQEWVESHGFTVGDLRIVRDLVSGVSPAFAYVSLSNHQELQTAHKALDGKMLRTRKLVIRRVRSGPTLFPARRDLG
jgi:RNA recognition motif-containing protein